MGKSTRGRLPPRAAIDSRTMPSNKHRMKQSGPAIAGRSCKTSSVLLSLLVAFGLALFTIFSFTLRAGHAGHRESLTQVFQEGDRRGMEMDVEEIGETDKQLGLEGDGVGIYGYEVVREFNHDPRAFTQGLAYAGNGTLYESTGLNGKSTVREVDLLTGKVRQKHQMEARYFGEGLTIWKDRLFQVVWREKKVLVYDRHTLAPQGELSHHMQDGWGLTSSGKHIIGSDGTSKLYFMNPDTFEEVKVLTVKDEDKNVGWLNELEFVNNEIWANVWQGGCIARISPRDGKVTGWILLHGLRNELLASGFQGLNVLNGIAWDSEEDKVYVTGKLWPKLYEIKLLNKTHSASGSLQAVRGLCNVGREGFA